MNARDKIAEIVRDNMSRDPDTDDYRDAADAILSALPDMIPDLVWGPEDMNGGFYCGFSLAAGFSAYYDIQQSNYGLAEVRYGILCHEYGDEVVWKGPKAEAKAAANAHNKAQFAKAMGWGK